MFTVENADLSGDRVRGDMFWDSADGDTGVWIGERELGRGLGECRKLRAIFVLQSISRAADVRGGGLRGYVHVVVS